MPVTPIKSDNHVTPEPPKDLTSAPAKFSFKKAEPGNKKTLPMNGSKK